ncbi:Polyadenylate-binding protein 2 [Dendrobium catenatum]|uniref:Polyadenylate-binding protein 2 n=1 Tax=Dendrobium catenatum TaxID=906689 RepID=A0A2I0VAN0_9ASPA|nr:Polyadenylate-binding protein 2 [Dendrobium catenatum]
MYSNHDPSLHKSGEANIFTKNLDKTIENKALMDTFSVFGNIHSSKIETDESGWSKGLCFVQFDQKEAALNAIEKLNDMFLNDKPIYVGHFQRDGKSKYFGFVSFENSDDAARAVNELNGKKFDEKECCSKASRELLEMNGKLIGSKHLYVALAQKKEERRAQLQPQFNSRRPVSVAKVTGMLLEMNRTEVLHLLESPEALKVKVFESMEVLKDGAPTNKLALLLELQPLVKTFLIF